ncbi:MAG: hypothetical protein QOC95_663 [Thermoleophilaceae bacterium]|nr:hypothetical protein [Thermoleophilaceae bacterium]
MLVMGPAASAFATAKVRFVNARAGSPPVRLRVTAGSAPAPQGGATSFGQITPYASVPSGTAQLSIGAGSGSAASATTTQQLTDGARYTAVALAKGTKGFELKVYEDGKAKAGTARLRVLHAAPELGSPNVRLGQRTIAEAVAFRTASPYLSVDPGAYTLSVVRPGGTKAIFQKRVSLSAGVATTAILAGSAGARERLIVATDDTVTPAGAPETGLGGLAGGGGPQWLLIALAALTAGAMGGLAQVALARRNGRR